MIFVNLLCLSGPSNHFPIVLLWEVICKGSRISVLGDTSYMSVVLW